MKIQVNKRNGNKLAELELGNEATARDLSIALSKQFPKYTPDRSAFTLQEKKLKPEDKLAANGNGTERLQVTFKDLGPQISWKTVFLVEYLGPMLIHPLLYFSSPIKTKSQVQQVILWLSVLHFAKRELETLLVHRFSHSTMPAMNIFKNSFHYWVLSGLWLAYDVYFSAQFANEQMNTGRWALVAIWAVSEVANLHTHLTLMNLRPPGTRIRRIPKGFGFSSIFHLSCPNYFFESIAWLALSGIVYRSVGAWVFTILAIGQMYAWAVKKHKNYKKEFSNYPRDRRPMFPFF